MNILLLLTVITLSQTPAPIPNKLDGGLSEVAGMRRYIHQIKSELEHEAPYSPQRLRNIERHRNDLRYKGSPLTPPEDRLTIHLIEAAGAGRLGTLATNQH